jgi:phosphonate transport system substrate-binding protein
MSGIMNISGTFQAAKVCAVVTTLSLAFSAASQADISIKFGTYAPDKPTAMVKQLSPSLRELSKLTTKILGEPVQIQLKIVRGYAAGVKQIVDGNVDFTRVGPASYVRAKDASPGIRILAMEKKRGKKTFNGIIAVHSDSSINTLQDLRDRTFGFGNQRSTLGRYFAQLYLMEAGIRGSDLKSFKYLGRHDKVGRAVGAKLVDAGALEETTFYKLVKAGVPIRAIAKMENATRPWIARGGLNRRVFEGLRKAMLGLTNKQALKALRFDGFLPGNDADYAATRRAIRENGKFLSPKKVTSAR